MQQLRKVRFLAEVPTAFSETAKIVGSVQCLGRWSPLHGHLLQTSHLLYPYWRSIVEVELPYERNELPYVSGDRVQAGRSAARRELSVGKWPQSFDPSGGIDDYQVPMGAKLNLSVALR